MEDEVERARAGLRAAGRMATSLLAARGERVAVVETTAGGLLGLVLTGDEFPPVFAGSVVAYSAQAKQQLFGVDPAAGGHGAVSAEMATALARAARTAMAADWGIAETGIAGPQAGRRSAKSAGLGFVAVAGARARAREIRTGLDIRVLNQMAFARAVLNLLVDALQSACC